MPGKVQDFFLCSFLLRFVSAGKYGRMIQLANTLESAGLWIEFCGY
ncbi:TPA: RepA leader peptide Tap [Salmonella enterica subsp. enterica serovar Give]|nr:RepA leader peptide Tap [Salmonella enterica]